MQQKTTWMRYLTLGLLISISLISNSCRKEDYEKYPTFYLINETDYNVTFDNYPDNYFIPPQSTISIIENQIVKGLSDNANNYSSPYKRIDNSPIIVRFDSLKCLLNHIEKSEHSIVDIKNFIAEKVGKYDYKFTYTFTEADYNRAVTCH